MQNFKDRWNRARGKDTTISLWCLVPAMNCRVSTSGAQSSETSNKTHGGCVGAWMAQAPKDSMILTWEFKWWPENWWLKRKTQQGFTFNRRNDQTLVAYNLLSERSHHMGGRPCTTLPPYHKLDYEIFSPAFAKLKSQALCIRTPKAEAHINYPEDFYFCKDRVPKTEY